MRDRELCWVSLRTELVKRYVKKQIPCKPQFNTFFLLFFNFLKNSTILMSIHQLPSHWKRRQKIILGICVHQLIKLPSHYKARKTKGKQLLIYTVKRIYSGNMFLFWYLCRSESVNSVLTVSLARSNILKVAILFFINGVQLKVKK